MSNTNNIEQQFTINAAQALQQLQVLDRAFDRFEQRIASVASTLGALNSVGLNGFKNLQGNVQDLNTALRSLNTLTNQSNQATSKLTVSFETLSRVIQTQVIVQSMNAIRDAIRESVSDAAQLQQQYALIATIAQRVDRVGGPSTPVDNETIAQAARGISDSLNIPQLQVAEGLYNAISNQVGSFAESITFATEAGKFARATNASLADSVDSLSAVLKSYNLNAADTGRISDILFATIDKGRVTANELGSTLGRVLPAASELGVSFEEVSASIAAISVKGLSTDETLTQVRATFSGLIKPSEAMQEAFDKLGIASARAGIRQFGLVGLLQKLREEYGQNEQALGKLFPNVRNIGAVFALTGENLADYEKTLAAVTNSQGAAEKAFQTATNTGVEPLSQAYNKLKNALADLSGEYLTSAGNIVKATGFMELSDETIGLIINTTGKAVVTAGALAVGFYGLSTASGVLATSLANLGRIAVANPIGAIAVAVAAAGVALNTFETNRVNQITAELDKLDAASLKNVEAELKRFSEASTARIKELKTAIGAGSTSIGDLVSQTRSSLIALGNADAAYVSRVTTVVNEFVGAREKLLEGLRSAVSESRTLVDQARGNIRSLQDEQRDAVFNRSLEGRSDSQRASALLVRSAALAREAEDAFRRASANGDQAGLARGRQLFEQAKGLAQESEQIAKQNNLRSAATDAQRRLDTLVQQQIKREEDLVRLQQQRGKEAQALTKEQERQVEQAKVLAKEVIANSSILDNQGKAVDPGELRARTERRDIALRGLQDLGVAPGELDLGRILNVQNLRGLAQDQLRDLSAELTIVIQNREGLLSELDAINQRFSSSDFIKTLTGGQTTSLGELDNLIDGLTSSAEKYENANTAIETSSKNRIATLESMQRQLEAVENSVDRFNLGNLRGVAAIGGFDNDGYSDAIREAVPELRAIIGEAISNPEVDTDALKARFAAVYSSLGEAAANSVNFFNSFDEENTGLERLAEYFRRVLDETDKVKAAQQDIGNIPQSNLDRIQELIDKYGSLESAARRAAVARQQAEGTITSPSRNAVESFNNGGLARGKDTIAARLAPGETVVNARSSAKFFAQLNALNGGSMPTARASSKVINFGDINVTTGVQGSDSSATAREIANALRRELRRGTSSL